MLALDHGLSVHSSPVMDLTDMDKARLGTDRTEAFKRSIALMASMPSTTAGILDAESRQLEHRVNMLFYGILMQGVPELGTVIVALGSKQNGREPWANSLIVMAHYYRHPDVSTFNVTPDVLTAGLRDELTRSEQDGRIAPALAVASLAADLGPETYIITAEPLLIQIYSDVGTRVIDLASLDDTQVQGRVTRGNGVATLYLDQEAYRTEADRKRYATQLDFLDQLSRNALQSERQFTVWQVE